MEKLIISIFVLYKASGTWFVPEKAHMTCNWCFGKVFSPWKSLKMRTIQLMSPVLSRRCSRLRMSWAVSLSGWPRRAAIDECNVSDGIIMHSYGGLPPPLPVFHRISDQCWFIEQVNSHPSVVSWYLKFPLYSPTNERSPFSQSYNPYNRNLYIQKLILSDHFYVLASTYTHCLKNIWASY